MRRTIASLGVMALCGAGAVSAQASSTQPSLRVMCRVNMSRIDPSKVRTPDQITGLCKHRASASSVVYANCGYSSIFDQKLGNGWITEYAGAGVWRWTGGIRYGAASLRWYNFSSRSHYGVENAPIYGGRSSWDDVHHAYTHRGLIGSWLAAAVLTGRGFVCSNLRIEPYDFVRV